MNPLQLMDTVGERNYISKHNSNYQQIEAAINALQQTSTSQAMIAATGGQAFYGLLGEQTALIGSSSFNQSTSGTVMNFTPGYVWRPTDGAVAKNLSSSSANFLGKTAGTYFVAFDVSGTPVVSLDSTEAVYSVVWTGTTFGTITLLAKTIWGAAEWIACESSAALGATYLSLDQRLEAGETKAVQGDLARTWNKGRIEITVTGADVGLTATEANNFAIDFKGALTGDRIVTLPSGGPRGWVLRNKTTGPYSLTVKISGGTGFKLARNVSMWTMYDSTELYAIAGSGKPAVVSLTYAASMTADFNNVDTVKVTLTGDGAFTLTGAADKQNCTLEVTQDGTGGRAISFGAEVRTGTDLTVIDISTDPGKMTKIGFEYDADSGKYDLVAIMRGF